jgi:hypothetical protein
MKGIERRKLLIEFGEEALGRIRRSCECDTEINVR